MRLLQHFIQYPPVGNMRPRGKNLRRSVIILLRLYNSFLLDPFTIINNFKPVAGSADLELEIKKCVRRRAKRIKPAWIMKNFAPIFSFRQLFPHFSQKKIRKDLCRNGLVFLKRTQPSTKLLAIFVFSVILSRSDIDGSFFLFAKKPILLSSGLRQIGERQESYRSPTRFIFNEII